MKPWHRDGLAGAGLLLFVLAGFIASVILGLLVAGAALILIAVLAVPSGKEDSDGTG